MINYYVRINDVIESLNSHWLSGSCARRIADEQIDKVKKLPFVTLERKKGKWVNGNPICPCCGEDKFKDLDADIWSDWKPKYCPNCGAEMENKEKK